MVLLSFVSSAAAVLLPPQAVSMDISMPETISIMPSFFSLLTLLMVFLLHFACKAKAHALKEKGYGKHTVPYQYMMKGTA